MALRIFSFQAANEAIQKWIEARPGRTKSKSINDALRYVMIKESNGLEIEDVQELLIEVRRNIGAIGNNLNQIARGVNADNAKGRMPRGLEGLETEYEELRKLTPQLRRVIRYWS